MQNKNNVFERLSETDVIRGKLYPKDCMYKKKKKGRTPVIPVTITISIVSLIFVLSTKLLDVFAADRKETSSSRYYYRKNEVPIRTDNKTFRYG